MKPPLHLVRSPLCSSDALIGWELDDVLLGDAGIVAGLPDRPYRELPEHQYTPLTPRLRRPTDTGWGAWHERELEAYRKRCEKRRIQSEREVHVPTLHAYVGNSVPDWWAMWLFAWIDIGWCMYRTRGNKFAINHKELIKDGAVTIHFMHDEKMPICRLCNCTTLFLVGSVLHLCVPCWARDPIAF